MNTTQKYKTKCIHVFIINFNPEDLETPTTKFGSVGNVAFRQLRVD